MSEESNNNKGGNGKKRARVDSDESDQDLHESKRLRVSQESAESRVDEELPELRVDPDLDSFEEPGSIGNDILEILDDPEAITEIPDLDSVIKSFEEEIMNPAPVPEEESGESQPDLGYLLEASDDELGIPPAVSPHNEDEKKSEVPGYDSFRFEDELAGYDSFGFGFGVDINESNQFVNVGGLFEYSEESADFAEFLWRPETESLPAV